MVLSQEFCRLAGDESEHLGPAAEEALGFLWPEMVNPKALCRAQRGFKMIDVGYVRTLDIDCFREFCNVAQMHELHV